GRVWKVPSILHENFALPTVQDGELRREAFVVSHQELRQRQKVLRVGNDQAVRLLQGTQPVSQVCSHHLKARVIPQMSHRARPPNRACQGSASSTAYLPH